MASVVRHQQTQQQIGLRCDGGGGGGSSLSACVFDGRAWHADGGRDEATRAYGWCEQNDVYGPKRTKQRLDDGDDAYGDVVVLREMNVSRRPNNGSSMSGSQRANKPPQVVEKRNARERRRVQAVNSAFHRLRKAVPIENTRGKRVSKVKTLQKAIEYINGLQELLKLDGSFYPDHFEIQYRYNVDDEYTLNILENYHSEF